MQWDLNKLWNLWYNNSGHAVGMSGLGFNYQAMQYRQLLASAPMFSEAVLPRHEAKEMIRDTRSMHWRDMARVMKIICQPSGIVVTYFVFGTWGLVLGSQSSQIARSVTNASPLLWHFFGAVLSRCLTVEMGPAIRYTLRHNIVDFLKYRYVIWQSLQNVEFCCLVRSSIFWSSLSFSRVLFSAVV